MSQRMQLKLGTAFSGRKKKKKEIRELQIFIFIILKEIFCFLVLK